MEKGEEIYGVCLREMNEETGIDLNRINILASHQLPTRKYQKQAKSLDSYLVISDTDFSSHHFTSNMVEGKDFAENDKWKWVSI